MRRVVSSMSLLALVLLCPACAGEQPEVLCKEIAINSAGTFGFETKSIVATATGSGGLNGVANYVLVSAPPTLKAEVQKVIVMADVRSNHAMECRVSTGDKSVSCVTRLLDRGLQIVVKFRLRGSEDDLEVYKAETDKIASYVSQNVICGR
jgi:hypothetical protein